MTERFTNGAISTLNGAIADTDVTLTVTDPAGFPDSGNFRLRIYAEGGNADEIVLVMEVAGSVFTITRAAEPIADGTQVAQAHSDTAVVAHVLSAAVVTEMAVRWEPLVSGLEPTSDRWEVIVGSNDLVGAFLDGGPTPLSAGGDWVYALAEEGHFPLVFADGDIVMVGVPL